MYPYQSPLELLSFSLWKAWLPLLVLVSEFPLDTCPYFLQSFLVDFGDYLCLARLVFDEVSRLLLVGLLRLCASGFSSTASLSALISLTSFLVLLQEVIKLVYETVFRLLYLCLQVRVTSLCLSGCQLKKELDIHYLEPLIDSPCVQPFQWLSTFHMPSDKLNSGVDIVFYPFVQNYLSNWNCAFSAFDTCMVDFGDNVDEFTVGLVSMYILILGFPIESNYLVPTWVVDSLLLLPDCIIEEHFDD
ncbi:hypothetical protein Tco_1491428 [Tanacetum coccineum]